LNRHNQKVKLLELAENEGEEQKEMEFLTGLLPLLRLPLINIKNLATEIKFSGFFNYESIFEAIQFKTAQEVINKQELDAQTRFQYRGVDMNFSSVNADLALTKQ